MSFDMACATLLVLAAVGSSAFGAVPPSTVEALRDVWEHTGGPYWGDGCWIGSTWNDTDPCDAASPWRTKELVACDPSGSAVLGLFLTLCNLTGTVPASIGNLTNLTYLYLFSNHLSGSIPREIGSLTNLIQLDLDTNQLSGSIPAEIGGLVNLQYLSLFSNKLSGSIPGEIGNLTNLLRLYLYSNQLSGSIPDEIGNLTNLLLSNSNRISSVDPSQKQSEVWSTW